MDITFSLEDIEDQFSDNSLIRGKTYYQRGNVKKYQASHDFHKIYGVVIGSGSRNYDQNITIVNRRRHNRPKIIGGCTCPVSYNCKHVVAVLFTLLEENKIPKAAIGNTSIRDRWQEWQRSNLAEGHIYENPLTSNQHLLYTLNWNQQYNSPHVSVNIYSARPLKKGGYGKSQREQLYRANHLSSRRNDKRIVGLLKLLSELNSRSALRGKEGALLLDQLLKSQRLFNNMEEQIPIRQGEPVELALQWDTAGSTTELNLIVGGLASGWRLIPTDPPSYFDPNMNTIGLISTSIHGETLEKLVDMPPVPEDALVKAFPYLQSLVGVNTLPTPKSLSLNVIDETVRPALTLKTIQPPHSTERIHVAYFRLLYGPISLSRDEAFSKQPATTELQEYQGQLYRLNRDFIREEEAIQTLFKWPWHFDPDQPDQPFLTFLNSGSTTEVIEQWHQFIQEGIPELKTSGWLIEIEDNFSLKIHTVEEWGWEAEQESNDWFSLGVTIDIDGRSLSLIPLLIGYLELGQEPHEKKESLIPFGSGQYIRLPNQLFKDLSALLEEWYNSESNGLRIPRYAVGDLQKQEIIWSGNNNLKTLARHLHKGPKPIKPPRALRAQLRPYQQAGLNWLQHLRRLNMNGILADDMGLGKTLQTLGHLLKEKEGGRLKSPALVIVPTSLLGNWHQEAERFAPNLSVLILHGNQRHENYTLIPQSDLVITTYPLIVRDEEILRNQEFHILILDEAQVIKNYKSKASQVVRTLNAQHRICLTGTPLENHLGELWSLFDFLMPGFLQNRKKFNTLYRTPIEKQSSEEKQGQLNHRISPFLLRRTKQEVAKELPAKTEIIYRVNFGKTQATLYETVRAAMEKRVRDLMKKKGLNRSQIEILDALLKLRQTCCDPQLVKLEKARKVKQSAKLEALMELLPEMVEEGRKILLFSQFTEMLGKIASKLDQANISHVKLTGQTRRRQETIDAFQNGDIPVFLISLKAGGVGLNLTAADTVIHYDPWWNPAVENQATDRAHRIGQDKPIFVYKLICENTVEEKILELQAQKQALADAVYSKNHETVKMDSEQWLALFR
ncbi:DEAD/DEAH box helicase [Microbulbifer sp. 2205BS26-8]|uniref:DEAD/DEAH box helicase n=1 Tax=Microbulbifer sp. 2205BS26-8 TaxID=3064386 RepID=UPI00273E688D|nr:DEAD/DEAH box helicase [Microbulbifer sp. 2205BS26-8]MDP5210421.1 DEAD/DEAH box helicase [Microbulbifer sp. 2205BS26-8]